MRNLCHLSVEGVVNGIKNRDFSAEEYISQILERIEKIDKKINAYTVVNSSGASEKARSIDKKIRNGAEEGGIKDIGPLAGVAVGIKDAPGLYLTI